MNIISLLANDNYIIVNKELIKIIGLEESIIVGDLASMYLYLQKENRLTEDGFFFYSVEAMQENTSLSDYQQRKALETLKKLNVVEIERRQVPAKRFIKLNIVKLENIFNSSSQKIKELDLKKFELNNILLSKDNNKNNNTLSKDKVNTSSKKSGLLGENLSKSKPKKENKNELIINNLKKKLFKKFSDTNIIDLLGKWIEELYDKNKGIGTNSLDIAIEQLNKFDKSQWEEVIKKATLNGWRDFSYFSPKENNLKFNTQISTEEERQKLKEEISKSKNFF